MFADWDTCILLFYTPFLSQIWYSSMLQCSCLENPRDGRAWWAAVYRVAQSWTQLKWLSSSSAVWNKMYFHKQSDFPLVILLQGILKYMYQSVLKEINTWIFIRRTDTEAEVPVLWLPDAESWLIGKDPDAGKDWRKEEQRAAEDEMAR